MESTSEIVTSCMLKHVSGYELKIQADRREGARERLMGGHGEGEKWGKDRGKRIKDKMPEGARSRCFYLGPRFKDSMVMLDEF
jgi:hypothetical protein